MDNRIVNRTSKATAYMFMIAIAPLWLFTGHMLIMAIGAGDMEFIILFGVLTFGNLFFEYLLFKNSNNSVIFDYEGVTVVKGKKETFTPWKDNQYGYIYRFSKYKHHRLILSPRPLSEAEVKQIRYEREAEANSRKIPADITIVTIMGDKQLPQIKELLDKKLTFFGSYDANVRL